MTILPWVSNGGVGSPDPDDLEQFVSEVRLRDDLKAAAKIMGRQELRFIADSFEQRQLDRIRTAHRQRTTLGAGEPGAVLAYLAQRELALEKILGAVMGIAAREDPLGKWMLSQKGVGPLLSARLVALGNWGAPNAAKVLAFAGFNPDRKWAKGEKRPWSARLKRLCYLLGESFVKVSNNDGAFYGKVYREAKDEYWARNLRGDYVEVARAERAHVDKATEKWKWNNGCFTVEQAKERIAGVMPEAGEPGSGLEMLAPGHIHDRARRKTVKLFLCHAWEVEQRLNNPGVEPPRPWVIEHGGHTKYIRPPGFEPRPG